MPSFFQVHTLFWTDPKVFAWNQVEKNLALYLLTCDHRNLEGYYRLPYAYISADLGLERDEVTVALERLIRDDFCRYDVDAQVVFLPKALKYRQPTTARHVEGAVNDLRAVPDSYLYADFQEAAAMYAPALSKVIGEPSEWAARDRETTHTNGTS